MSRTTMVIKSSVVLLLLTALFLSNFHVGHAFLNFGKITNKIVCTDRCYKQHPATSSPDFTRCVGDCYGESKKGFAGRSFFFDDSDSSTTRIMKSRSLKKNKKRLSAPKKVNYRRYSTKSDNEEFDEACFTVRCSFMSTCCGGKCYSSRESMGKTCSKGVLCGFSEKSCGGACYNTFSQECSKSGRIVPRGYTGDEEEETAKPSKPAVNPNLFTKFNATIISKQLELVVLAALGFPSASNAQLEKLVDMEIDSTLYNDMRKLSEEFLDGFNRNQDELTIREAFSEFLSSLDMPSDIRETVEQHADMTALKQSLADKQAEYATREENCLANYKGMMAARYEKDEYKQLFCSYLNALAGSVSAMEGQIYAKRYELQGHWATLLNFLDNGYEASVSNGKDGLWTTSPSIKVFEQNARRAVEPSLVLKLSRSQAMDNAMDSSIVIDYLTMRENVTETRNVTKVVNGTSVTETITEIKVKEYQVVDQSTFYQKSDLVLSNNNQGYYAFPKANVTFAIEFGAMAHSVVTVRPGSDWFSTQVINQYKMGPFKDGYVPSQFFGKNGSLQQYLKSLTLVVDPYVTLTVDKSLKEFIENNKKVTIFNLPFDITPQTGNADIQVSELVDYPNIFSVTLRRRNSNPLVLATELTA